MRGLVVGAALVALAGCAETAAMTQLRSACAGGDTGACQAVVSTEQRQAAAAAAGMQSMSQSFYQSANQQTTTTCHRYSPYSVTCQSY